MYFIVDDLKKPNKEIKLTTDNGDGESWMQNWWAAPCRFSVFLSISFRRGVNGLLVYILGVGFHSMRSFDRFSLDPPPVPYWQQ